MTALFVLAAFTGLAILFVAVEGIINYFDNGPLWQLVAGVSVCVVFGTFWVYMRTHYWR
jgi:hypothetical protein